MFTWITLMTWSVSDLTRKSWSVGCRNFEIKLRNYTNYNSFVTIQYCKLITCNEWNVYHVIVWLDWVPINSTFKTSKPTTTQSYVFCCHLLWLLKFWLDQLIVYRFHMFLCSIFAFFFFCYSFSLIFSMCFFFLLISVKA